MNFVPDHFFGSTRAYRRFARNRDIFETRARKLCCRVGRSPRARTGKASEPDQISQSGGYLEEPRKCIERTFGSMRICMRRLTRLTNKSFRSTISANSAEEIGCIFG